MPYFDLPSFIVIKSQTLFVSLFHRQWYEGFLKQIYSRIIKLCGVFIAGMREALDFAFQRQLWSGYIHNSEETIGQSVV